MPSKAIPKKEKIGSLSVPIAAGKKGRKIGRIEAEVVRIETEQIDKERYQGPLAHVFISDGSGEIEFTYFGEFDGQIGDTVKLTETWLKKRWGSTMKQYADDPLAHMVLSKGRGQIEIVAKSKPKQPKDDDRDEEKLQKLSKAELVEKAKFYRDEKGFTDLKVNNKMNKAQLVHEIAKRMLVDF
jgi:hypothetical protein